MLKSLLRSLLPKSLREAYRSYLRQRRRKQAAGDRSTEEIFTSIYRENIWGGEPGTLYSGSGSALPEIVEPYVAAVRAWLPTVGAEKLRVVDLGCGDFRVGSRLVDLCGHYTGVDIVPDVVAANTKAHGSERVSFVQRDITAEDPPAGEICFVRQVFQHLSNDLILRALPRLAAYRWVVITEHHPSPERLRKKNVDITHGLDIRIDDGSGVYLDEAPFHFDRGRRMQLLLEVPAVLFTESLDKGFVRTWVFERT